MPPAFLTPAHCSADSVLVSCVSTAVQCGLPCKKLEALRLAREMKKGNQKKKELARMRVTGAVAMRVERVRVRTVVGRLAGEMPMDALHTLMAVMAKDSPTHIPFLTCTMRAVSSHHRACMRHWHVPQGCLVLLAMRCTIQHAHAFEPYVRMSATCCMLHEAARARVTAWKARLQQARVAALNEEWRGARVLVPWPEDLEEWGKAYRRVHRYGAMGVVECAGCTGTVR